MRTARGGAVAEHSAADTSVASRAGTRHACKSCNPFQATLRPNNLHPFSSPHPNQVGFELRHQGERLEEQSSDEVGRIVD